MNNIQEILDKIGKSKFATLSSERVHHYYGDKMIGWRNSVENRIRNQGQWRPNQKMTPEQGEECRKLHWENNMSITELTLKYGVSPSSIKKILNNKRFWNPNTPYVGIKFRNTPIKKGAKLGPYKNRKIVSVYDEDMNFIEEGVGQEIASSMGFKPNFLNTFLLKTKNNFHKGTKRYYFDKRKSPNFVKTITSGTGHNLNINHYDTINETC